MTRLALLLWLVALPVTATQVGPIRVQRNGSRFDIEMQLRVDAPPQAVFRALQDYRALPRFNPEIRHVRVRPGPRPGQVRLSTVIHSCVLLFCKTLRQQQIMTARADAEGGVLDARLLPGEDFRGGDGVWTVRPCPARPQTSCLRAALHMQVKFWVPPLIGGWIIRGKMEREARRTVRGLQEIAQGAAPATGR